VWNVLVRCLVAPNDVLGWASSWAEGIHNLSAFVDLDDEDDLVKSFVVSIGERSRYS